MYMYDILHIGHAIYYTLDMHRTYVGSVNTEFEIVHMQYYMYMYKKQNYLFVCHFHNRATLSVHVHLLLVV